MWHKKKRLLTSPSCGISFFCYLLFPCPSRLFLLSSLFLDASFSRHLCLFSSLALGIYLFLILSLQFSLFGHLFLVASPPFDAFLLPSLFHVSLHWNLFHPFPLHIYFFSLSLHYFLSLSHVCYFLLISFPWHLSSNTQITLTQQLPHSKSSSQNWISAPTQPQDNFEAFLPRSKPPKWTKNLPPHRA